MDSKKKTLTSDDFVTERVVGRRSMLGMVGGRQALAPLKEPITERLKDGYIRDPQVTVLVKEFPITVTDDWFDLLLEDEEHPSLLNALEIIPAE